MEIERELLREKAIVEDKRLPISGYNYSALRDRLRKKGIKVSVNTIIDRAKRSDCYKARQKRKTHDREVLTASVSALIQHDSSLHLWSPFSLAWGSPTDETITLMPETPGISIRRADGEHLKQLVHTDWVTVTIIAQVDTGWRQIPLLVAEHPDLRDYEDFVLLSSHIDSWHYGAMDNTSANATVLEVARLLGETSDHLKRGLRLAFWSGHSHGRFCGSAWYADQHWHELHDRCVCHMNADSTGGVGAKIVTEPPVIPETKALVADVIAKVAAEKFEGKRIGRFADQSFYGIGLPSIFGTFSEQAASEPAGGISFKTGGRRSGGLGWWWHTPHDTVDKVDEKNLVRDTRVYLGVALRLCSAEPLPFDYRKAASDLPSTVETLEAEAGEAFRPNQPH
jgi:hypothetical protein